MKTKLSLLIIILFLSLQASTQIVDIPDPYFKALLIHLYDINNDNEIQVAEAEMATGWISMEYSEEEPGLIQSLTGIEAFINITGLHINYCPIEVIDLSQNLALEVISCSHNSLTSLTLGDNTTLTELYCGDNLLTSIDISQNTDLEVFDCRENDLTYIDLSNCTSLIDLKIASNQLTNLEVNFNNKLEYLNCSNNSISYVDISNNIFLEYLLCGENQLTEINLDNNTNLIWLWCKSNLLSNINLSLNPVVRFINCSNNHLTFLDVQNGNNSNFIQFIADSNPDLNCIFVDDVEFSETHWLPESSHFIFDPHSNFVQTQEQCDNLHITTCNASNSFTVLPNPVISTFSIKTTEDYNKIKIVSTLGQSIHYSRKNDNYTLDVTPGIYFIQINTSKGIIIKKFIKQ